MKASPMVWTGRVLTALFALFMLGASVAPKFLMPHLAETAMEPIGWPTKYVLLIGTIELVFTVLYLIPRTAVLGAVLMTGLLGGAIAANLRVEMPLFSHTLFGIYLGLVMWGGLWLRDASVRALFPDPQEPRMSVAANIPEHLTRLSIVREFEAPRALVWKMWTDPAHVGVWFAPEHFTTPVVRMDVRPGGAIHMVMRAPDGSEHPFDGRFVALDEPGKLVMRTWINLPDGETWFEVEQTVRFEEAGDRTIMRFEAVVVSAREDAVGPLSGMAMGWNQSLDKMERHIRELTRG